MASSPEFDDAEFKWLVTELLLTLPFIRDIFAWADVWDCSKKRMIEFFKKGENLGILQYCFVIVLFKNNICC